MWTLEWPRVSGAFLSNCVGDLSRKYGNYLSLSPFLISVYISIIIKVMKGMLFF